MDDLQSRLANRVQLTSDGHKAYLDAVEDAQGAPDDPGHRGWLDRLTDKLVDMSEVGAADR
jgi:hypothetical protein